MSHAFFWLDLKVISKEMVFLDRCMNILCVYIDIDIILCVEKTFYPKFIWKKWRSILDLFTRECKYMTPLLHLQNITGLCIIMDSKEK